MNSNIRKNYDNHTNYNNSYNYDKRDIQKIIDYIYSSTEISRFKYKILEYENDLNMLTTQKYFVSANFSGTSSLMVFIKIYDKFYSCLIDRKTLSYNRQQVRIENVKMTPINLRFDNSIYNGTIMDGVHVFNKRTNTNVFIMTDVYQFRGQDMTNDSIQHKIMNVTSYINSTLKNDKNINNINIVINKLYEVTKIEELISTMEKIGGYDMKGVVFFPEISGTKLLMLETKSNNINSVNNNFNDLSSQSIEDREKNTNDIVPPPELKDVQNKKKQKYRYICKSDDPVFACLEVRKTDLPDVYYVSCANKENINGKSIIKIIRLGIALIPNTETSMLCKSIINSKVNGKALMNCKFDQNKNKWIPLSEEVKLKLPSLWNEIENKIDILVESDSDNED